MFTIGNALNYQQQSNVKMSDYTPSDSILVEGRSSQGDFSFEAEKSCRVFGIQIDNARD